MALLDWDRPDGGLIERAPPPVDDASAFTRGLRSSLPGIEGQLRAVAGNVGEVAGASDFARDQYAQSRALQQQSEETGPAINTFKQVRDSPDLMTGLRNAYDYGTGMIGKSTLPMALGMGATLLTRNPRAGLAAATGAIAPMEIGSTIQQQQNDPVAMQASPGTRLVNATLVGTGRAAAMNVVPVAMTGKLLGRGVENAASKGLLPTMGENIAESAAGQAAAGVGGEGISVAGETALNPNRDRTGDSERFLEAGVGGATIGAPFGVIGGAGAYAHGRKQNALGGVGDLAEYVKGKLSEVGDKAGDAKKAVVDTVKEMAAARKIAKDELVDGYDAMETSDAKATEYADTWAQDMMSMANISPEIKAQLAKARETITSEVSRAFIAAKRLAMDTAGKIGPLADRVSESWARGKEGKKPEVSPEEATIQGNIDAAKKAHEVAMADTKDPMTPQDVQQHEAYIASKQAELDALRGAKKSEDLTGVHAKINEIIMPVLERQSPELLDFPNEAKLFGSLMHGVIGHMRDGTKLPPKTMKELHNYFGDELGATLLDVHDTVNGRGVTPELIKFYDSHKGMTEKATKHGVMADTIRSLHPDGENLSRQEVGEFIDQMRKHTRSAKLTPPPVYDPLEMTTEEQRATARHYESLIAAGDFEKAMKQEFGKNYEKVYDAFEKEHSGTKADVQNEAKKGDAGGEGDEETAKRMAATKGVEDWSLEGQDDLRGEFITPNVYTHNKYVDKVVDKKGKESAPSVNPFVLRPDVHDNLYPSNAGEGKGHARGVETRWKAENPGRSVDVISAREYVDTYNFHDPEELLAHAKAWADEKFSKNDPKKHSEMIKYKNAYNISEKKLMQWTDGKPDDYVVIVAEGNKQDASITPAQMKGLQLDSKNFSKADTRVNIGGQAYNAAYITSFFLKRVPKDITDARARVAQAFYDGVAAVVEERGGSLDKYTPEKLAALHSEIKGAEAAVTKASLRDIPEAVLDSMTIPREILSDGEYRTEQVNIREALNDGLKERKAFRELLTCVGG